jgi:hypothetical protein
LFGVKKLCLMCLTDLPPGPEQLFENEAQLCFRFSNALCEMLGRGLR